MISRQQLKSLLVYDEQTGLFTWTQNAMPKSRVGTIAGYVGNGYRKIDINGVNYMAHSLVWLYVHGYIPRILDHINGDPDDNRIENLRLATFSQNSANSRKPEHNTSGAKGVQVTSSGKYQAAVTCKGKTHNLGTYATKDEAKKAYIEGATKHFGEFAHDGTRKAARLRKKKVGPLTMDWVRNGGKNDSVTPLYPNQKPSTLGNCKDRLVRKIIGSQRRIEKDKQDLQRFIDGFAKKQQKREDYFKNRKQPAPKGLTEPDKSDQ